MQFVKLINVSYEWKAVDDQLRGWDCVRPTYGAVSQQAQTQEVLSGLLQQIAIETEINFTW